MKKRGKHLWSTPGKLPFPRSTAVRIVYLALFVFTLVYSAHSAREAVLSVSVKDAATGRLTPVRVRLTDAAGQALRVPNGAVEVSDAALPIPRGAIAVMYGTYDRAEGFALQPDGACYADGSFEARLAPGTYRLTLSKGVEFVQQTHILKLGPGEAFSRTFELQRWIDMPQRGWYSGDDHIHLRRSPREDPLILRWIAAEDVHVGNLLQMGDFWATYYSQYAWGEEGRYREGDYILVSGQEGPRTSEIGHTISLGADEFVRFREDYYSYDRVFDRVHELGGVTGYAHQATSFHGYRGLTLNVLREKIDFLELMQFCVQEGPLALSHYYHYLDLGFQFTALAGSDFPWCGRGPRFGVAEGCSQIGGAGGCSQIGDVRFYTYTGDEFSFDRWLAGVKAGHTFVTSGPMLELTVNDRIPGDTLNVVRGTKIRIRAKAYGQRSQIPLSDLEIVGHGKILKAVSARETGQSMEELSIDLELAVDYGIWIAARSRAAIAQVAHTTPVYVSVAGGGFHNPETAHHYLDLSEKYLQELEQQLAHPSDRIGSQASRHKKSLERQIAEVREVLKKLASSLELH